MGHPARPGISEETRRSHSHRGWVGTGRGRGKGVGPKAAKATCGKVGLRKRESGKGGSPAVQELPSNARWRRGCPQRQGDREEAAEAQGGEDE